MVRIFAQRAFPLCSASADWLEGTVVPVADGDILTVLAAIPTQHRIRFGGIDAPEKRQAFGNVSRQQLADAVFQSRVRVE
ncbi:thermonuclease family protein [Methylolobus aquaticus]